MCQTCSSLTEYRAQEYSYQSQDKTKGKQSQDNKFSLRDVQDLVFELPKYRAQDVLKQLTRRREAETC